MHVSLDNLIKEYGSEHVNMLFLEYMMLIVAKNNALDKVSAYISNNGSITVDKYNELAGEINGEGESFHT